MEILLLLGFEFILQVGINKLYLDGRIVQEVIKQAEDIRFFMPNNQNEKISHLEDYVKLSIIDRKINDDEITLCKIIAISYGFRPVVINEMFKMFLS